MYFTCLMGCLLFFSNVVVGQNDLPEANPACRLLSDEDGLPSMEIYHLYQDSKGYLWIGSADGLSRYDGIRFKKYASKNLTGRALTGTIEDQSGRIWCHNFTGQILYLKNDSMHVQEEWLPNIRLGFPIIFVDRQDKLWAGSDKGLFWYEQSKKKWNKAPSPSGRKQNDVPLDISQDHRGQYWYINSMSEVFTTRDLKKWKPIQFTDNSISISPENELLSNPLLSTLGDKAMFFTRNNKSVFTYENGVFVRKKAIEGIFPKELVFTGVSTCLGKYFCLASYNGFYLFDSLYRPLNTRPFFPDKAISKVITDREGNWWIATLGSGILFFPSLEVMQLLPSENMGHRCLKVVSGPDGTILTAMQNGVIYQIDPESGKVLFRYITPIKKNVSAVHYWKEEDRIVTGSDIIISFKPGQSKAEVLLQQGCIKSIGAGPVGSLLYVSCFKSALLGSKKQDAVWNLVPPSPGMRPERMFRTNRCRTALYDNINNELWIAYQDGVYRYTPEGHTELVTKSGQSLYTSTMALQKDTLWVGTVSNGLYAFVDQKEIYHFNHENLLKTDAITSLALEPGKVWVGSYEGLARISLSEKKSLIYNKADGLPSNEINDLHLNKDRLWLATGKGLASIPTSLEPQNRHEPKVYLTGLLVNDRPTDLAKKPHLSHLDNNLLFELGGISFRSWGSFRYKYRMLGLDSGWQYSNASDHVARFISLPPGNYVFQAHAINEDGVESADFVNFPLEILRPFWMKWWFLSLVSLSMVGLVAFYFQNRIKQIQAKNKLALEQAKLKNEKEQIEQKLKISTLTAIKAQMNPHFIFNSLNAIQNFFITDDKSRANDYLGKFSDLMRRILEMSNKEQINLQEELESLNLYLELEQLRFGKSFSYQIQTELSMAPDEILLPTMLVQPYVENALKHGLLHKKSERKLEISFIQKSDFLRVKIEDNGVGRARSAQINAERKKYTSFSTSANQKRLYLLNSEFGGSLSVEIIDKLDDQNQAKGTIVWLNIPVNIND